MSEPIDVRQRNASMERLYELIQQRLDRCETYERAQVLLQTLSLGGLKRQEEGQKDGFCVKFSAGDKTLFALNLYPDGSGRFYFDLDYDYKSPYVDQQYKAAQAAILQLREL